MKYKVERCLECARAWVVLDERGRVVIEYQEWELAVEDAIIRFRIRVRESLMERIA